MKHHNHSHKKPNNVFTAFILNLSFSLAEIIGGLFTNSVAIISDAVHDLGDSLSLALSLYIEKRAEKKASAKYTYGYKRLRVIGALINIIILSAGVIYVVIKAVKTLGSPHKVISEGMFILAIFGILINGFAVLKMKGVKKILDKTIMLHLLEDLFGWLSVFIVSIVIYFTGFYLLDPILSLIISAIIIKNIITGAKEIINIIMQAVPDQKKYGEIKAKIDGIKGVIKTCDLHIWTLDGEENIVTAKLQIDDCSDKDAVLRQAKSILSEENITESTIEIYC